MTDPTPSRRFWLVRKQELPGDPDIAADGVEFPDGVVVLRWRTSPHTSIYDSIQDVLPLQGVAVYFIDNPTRETSHVAVK